MFQAVINGIKFSILTSLEKIVVVVLSLYLSQHLTQLEFGQYGLLLSLSLILNTVFIGGSNTILFRLISDKDYFPIRYDLLVSVFGISTKRMLISLPVLLTGYIVLLDPIIGPLPPSAIFIVAGSAALGSYLFLYLSVLLVERNYKLVGYITCIKISFLALPLILVEYLPIVEIRFIFELISTALILGIFVVPTVFSLVKSVHKSGSSQIAKLRSYGGYTLVIQFFMMGVNGYDKILLGVFKNQNDVAIYTMFCQFLIGIFIINAFNSVLSNQYFNQVKNNIEGFKASFNTAIILAVIALTLKFCILKFGSLVLKSLTSNVYLELVPHLVYIADIYFLYALYLTFSRHFHYKVDGKKLMYLTLSATSLGIFTTVVLIYWFGTVGAIFGAITTYFFLTVFCYSGARVIYRNYGTKRGDVCLSAVVMLTLGTSVVSLF